MEQSESQPGFFIHLSKYAPTRVATRLENSVTKASAYLLKCCPQVRESFLQLKLVAMADVCREIGADRLEKLKQEAGYAIDEWKQLCRILQLSDAPGHDAAREQARRGAGFVKAEVAV